MRNITVNNTVKIQKTDHTQYLTILILNLQLKACNITVKYSVKPLSYNIDH